MIFPELNERCLVEQKTITKDSTYQTEVETWSLLGVRWCRIMDDRPGRSESKIDGLEISRNTSSLQMNYCTDIDSNMRIILNRPTRTVYQIIAGPVILGDKDRVEFKVERISTEN